MLWYIIVFLENSREASKNHLGGNLVYLLVTDLAFIEAEQPRN